MNVLCLRRLRRLRRLPVSASHRLQHNLVATTLPVVSQNFLEQLLQNHKSSQESLLRQQESLLRRLDKANVKLVQRSDAAGEQKLEFRELELSSLSEIAKLNTKIKVIQNNLDLRTSMEIIAEVLRVRAKHLPKPIALPAIGVQPVLDAVVGGRFDTSLIHFNDAKKKIMAEVGGTTSRSVKHALDCIYGELSKHHHDGGGTTHLTVREGEQTPPEAIAALSVLLFARRLFHLSIDAEYQDSGGQRVLLLSKL
ncbi:hypothetical protein GGX14DRAFT_386939 [Mycena pura]|uniref:Uncharacterized protein n=1 Tax=Mycena pura TaxID=153505 RepID=A0AAD7E1U7_9AGAR|nr:hypothetical protein GGX14DRAFT_386939 [Mycena pura]